MTTYVDKNGNGLRPRDVVIVGHKDEVPSDRYSVLDLSDGYALISDVQGHTIRIDPAFLIRVNARNEKACKNCRFWVEILARNPNSEGLVGKGICVKTASDYNKPHSTWGETTAFSYQAVSHLTDDEKQRVFEKSTYLITNPEHYCSMHEYEGGK